MSRIKIMNTEIDNLTMSETLDCIDMLINTRVPSYVVTPNIDHIVQLETDVKLQKAYQKAALIITDGKPLIWISKYYKKTIKEKISGSDVFPLSRYVFIVILPCKYTGLYMSVYQNRTACPRFASRL